MRNNKIFLGVLTMALTLALVLACGGKKDSGSGGSAASGDSKPAASAPKASSGGGKEAKETDFVYELNKAGDGVIITDYQKDAAGGAVVIPAKIEGYPVVGMHIKGLGGFDESLSYMIKDEKTNQLRYMTDAEVKQKGMHPYITSMVFPDSITEIIIPGSNDYFFNGNPKLTSIVLPKNLKAIPHSFAHNVESLTSVKWPETLEIIGDRAFTATGLTEVVLPEGVKEIRDEAFSYCKNLTSVTIPASIEGIGDLAFNNCSLLATVKMPAKTIKYWNWEFGQASMYGAFSVCPKLTGIATRKAITDSGYKGSF